MRAAWLLLLAACTAPASRPTDPKATLVPPTPPPSSSSTAGAPSSTGGDGFSDAAVTSVVVANGRVVIGYTSQGKPAELTFGSLPAGLTWTRHAVSVSQEREQRPDGARTLTTVRDATGPVLIVGQNVGLGQKLPGGFAFAPGKAQGPSNQPRRQSVEVVLHDRTERVLAQTVPGKVVTFGAAPELWQLAVTQATVGGSDDEGPPLSVDLVLVKQ